MDHTDFAVIGAGIAGASIAAELAPHGSVLVAEAERHPGYHTTGRSAAFWEECYGGPGVVPLTLASGAWLREGGFLRERGALYIARADQLGLLDSFEQTFAGTGVSITRIARAGMERLVPGLQQGWVEAISEPQCADIDVAALHQHYLTQARQGGAQIATGHRLIAAERRGGLWHLAFEQGGQATARVLVNAAGAWADEVAQIAGGQAIGITPLRRTVVQLRVDPPVHPGLPLVLGIDGSFYFKPESGRIWLSPHDETPSPPCDAAPEELDVAHAIARFERVIACRIAAVERKWAGLRSFAPDRLPVYGWDGQAEGFFWFAGQGGFGIQTAPAAARLAAQIATGRGADAMTQAIDAAVYSPQRFV
ncbi:NAD(P)/FAD-dependent oxidoreductase [Alteraurantiacibacter palmitatis]|uniref:NAD(P)/FAD-dependent oxidoreductase n=1 Tax=Alteraurantiacibacter palmitatis TaxID=2054628 RepID=A0ABV7E7N2_9SPHN